MMSLETGSHAPVGSVADVASRIERIPFCIWHVKVRLLIGVATLFEGFSLLSITYVMPALVPEWNLSPGQIGALIGAAFMGGTISAVGTGWLAERYGRRRMILLATFGFSVANIACAFAWDFTSMATFRFLQGLAAGGEVAVAITYISELSRAEGRGKFILLYEMVFPVGLVLSAIAGWWLVSRGLWQWIFILGGTPGFLFLFLQRLLPESPRWLASRGRHEEAAEITAMIEQKTEAALGRPLPPVVPITVEQVSPTFWKDLFGPIYRSRTLMIWAVGLLCYLMNYCIVTWLPTLYLTEFDLTVDKALGYSLVTTATGLLGTLFCALFIDIVGRRAWFTSAFLAGAVCMLWVWHNGVSTPLQLLVSASVGYFFVSTISIGIYLYMPEIYPTRLRARGVGIATVWITIAGVLGPNLVGYVLGTRGMADVFLTTAIIGSLGAILVALFAVETRGRVLEEVSP